MYVCVYIYIYIYREREIPALDPSMISMLVFPPVLL